MSIGPRLKFLIYFHCAGLLATTGAKPFEDLIQMRLYRDGTKYYESTPISQAELLFHERRGYNQSLPLVLLIHGMATGADSHFVKELIEAFYKRQLKDEFNIFAVDMPEILENSIRNEFYLGILAGVQPAGQLIGEWLNKAIRLNLTAPENVNIIGYSMGAQVAGYIARVVKEPFGPINFIAGLDPAGPGFHTIWEGRRPLIHVSAADARTTHFYHTNSVTFGTRDRVGTADFVFNKGTVQPGCTKDAGVDCSHIRVPLLYIEAVSNPKYFIARKCSDWEDFKSCDCNSHETAHITFPPDLSAKGIYYLRTRPKSPFALGKRGSQCTKIVHMGSEMDHLKHTKLSHISKSSKMTSKVGHIKDSLYPKQKIKDNINMHLIKGIRKLEDLHRQVLDQLEPLKEEKESGKSESKI